MPNNAPTESTPPNPARAAYVPAVGDVIDYCGDTYELTSLDGRPPCVVRGKCTASSHGFAVGGYATFTLAELQLGTALLSRAATPPEPTRLESLATVLELQGHVLDALDCLVASEKLGRADGHVVNARTLVAQALRELSAAVKVSL